MAYENTNEVEGVVSTFTSEDGEWGMAIYADTAARFSENPDMNDLETRLRDAPDVFLMQITGAGVFPRRMVFTRLTPVGQWLPFAEMDGRGSVAWLS